MSRDRWEGDGISPGDVEDAVRSAMSDHRERTLVCVKAQMVASIFAGLAVQSTSIALRDGQTPPGDDILIDASVELADKILSKCGVV